MSEESRFDKVFKQACGEMAAAGMPAVAIGVYLKGAADMLKMVMEITELSDDEALVELTKLHSGVRSTALAAMTVLNKDNPKRDKMSVSSNSTVH